jgi:hypothetical protein
MWYSNVWVDRIVNSTPSIISQRHHDDPNHIHRPYHIDDTYTTQLSTSTSSMAASYVPPPLILARGGPVNNSSSSSGTSLTNNSSASAATSSNNNSSNNSSTATPQRGQRAVSMGPFLPTRSPSADTGLRQHPHSSSSYSPSSSSSPSSGHISASIGGAGVLVVKPRSDSTADLNMAMPAAVMDDYFTGPNTDTERQAEATRLKRAQAFAKMSTSNKRSYLAKEIKTYEQRIDAYRQLLATSDSKRKTARSALDASMDKLRRWMMITKLNQLQQLSHIQSLLADNHDAMCHACIIVLKERLALTAAALDDLNSVGDVRLEPSFFRSAKEASNNHAQLAPLLRERTELERQLHSAKIEYIRISRITEKEELIDRGVRIAKVLDDFISFFREPGVAGATPMTTSPSGALQLPTHYRPARAIEFEFSRFLLDERCREGVSLTK